MLFSVKEIEALQLLRWCRYVPKEELLKTFSEEEIEPLMKLGFMTLYKKRNGYILTNPGHRFLESFSDDLPEKVRPSYHEEDMQRKGRVAAFAITTYRAGLMTACAKSELEKTGTCYLTSQSRNTGINPWGNSRIAAIVHLGDILCSVHYIAPGIGKISLVDELNTFNNNTASLRDFRRAVIYTGESYESILEALSERNEEPESRRTTYADAFGKFSMPVFIVPCDTVGAMQLSMMRMPDYRQRMVKIAFGDTGIVSPPPADHPEWDAMYQGRPLVMAADMDFLRIDAAVGSAAASPYKKAYLLCLEGQKEPLRKKYKAKGMAESIIYILWEKPELKREVFLYTPPDRQFETAKGEVIHVPPIPTIHASKGNRKK